MTAISPLTPVRMCLWSMRYHRVSKLTLKQGLRGLSLRNLLALTRLWTLRLPRVSKHTIRQGLSPVTVFSRPCRKKCQFSMCNMALDLQISQDVKTRFEPKLEKPCALNLPVDLEKTLSDLRKHDKTWRHLEKTQKLPDLETNIKILCLQRATLRKIIP